VLFSITPFKGQSHTRSEFFTKKLTISSDSEFSAVLGNSSFLTSVPSLDVNYLDTVPVPYDTARKIFTDTPLIPRTDTLLISKDSLDAPIQYSAEDSGVLYVGARRFVLYGKANTKYTDINLESNTIIYDQASQMLKAYGGVDSADAAAFNKPKFIQGGTESIMDTLYYNIKTQKGLTKNTYYKEGELFVNALVVKKVSADVAYAYRGRFTTCNLDTPHFAIRARKLKMINNKIAVSGPAFPEFEMVPMPIGIPFGIYPLSKGRRTGLLPPQFAQNESFGLGLEGLGYYKVINEYWDVTTRANIYSYGGWRVDINPRYFKRYKYNGNLQLSIQRTKILNTGGNFKDEFTINRLFQINWSHRSDSKARPGTSFSANVAAGSTQFNNFVANNAFQNFNNQLQSSINYNKSWNEGKMNLSVSATHNQNSTSRLVSINLPNINFAVATIYPFQPKEQVGAQKWYEKLGVSYNTSVLTQASFYDSLFNIQRVLDTVRWGARHSVPISLALPALGPFILSPSISFDENWYSIRTLYGWNEIEGKIDTTIKKGFFAARDMSFGLSANTRIFGTIQFKRGHIMGIRHEIKPFISASFSPDLVKQYNTDVQIDTSGRKLALNQLQGNVVGAFSGGTFGGISFGIDNLLEMKVKDKKDTSAAAKKLRIIDGLNITSSYNFLVDSLQLSPFNISFRSSLIENMNITGGANIDPYEVDSTGIKINSLLFRQGKPGRLTNINLALSTRFQSKKKEDDRADEDRIPEDEMMTLEEQQRQLEYIRQNPADFVDFNIPWSLSVSFSLRYDRVFNRSTGAFDGILNSNVNLNGDLSITPKWKLGGGTFFDFKTRRIQTVSMFITREMHCWQMAINIQVGQFKSFNITLNPKSGILRDLRINKRFLQQ
jgi:hypothetical protein